MAIRGRKRTASGQIIIPEKNVQSTIITFLGRAKIMHNRVNGAQISVAGTNRRGNSSSRTIRCNSINGKGDIEIWLYADNSSSKQRIGITAYIEVKKSHGGVQSDNQKSFEENLNQRGHYYVVARSLNDVYKFLLYMKSDISEKLPGWELDIGRAKLT